ncbi:actin-related protein 2/3 complex subunit 3 [Hyaloraphidium curvatum]|nr:actin-related protein 2/3 complex subunit 3 [Hyaloraphidium curvatum]
MPGAYHSSFNEGDFRVVASLPLVPLKTKAKGPAPPQADAAADDAIDEALNLFRANCLFRNFEVKGNGDRLLIYLTVFISECLGKLAAKTPVPSLQDGVKLLNTHALQTFTLPGDPNFPLNAIFQKPSNPQETETLRSYLSQLRQETANRLCARIYDTDKAPSKWWLCFSKRRFMNITRSL